MTIDKFLITFPLYFKDKDGNSVIAPKQDSLDQFKKKHLGKIAIEFIEKNINLSFIDQIDNLKLLRKAWVSLVEGFFLNFFFEENKKNISYVDNSFERQLYNGWLQLLSLAFPKEINLSSLEETLKRLIEVNKSLVYYSDYSDKYILSLAANLIKDDSIKPIVEKLERNWLEISNRNQEKIKANSLIQYELERLLSSYMVVKEAENCEIGERMLLE